MKRLILPLVLLLAITVQAQNSTDLKKARIKHLFAVMHQDSLIIKTMDGMTASMMQNISGVFSDTMYTNHVDVNKYTQKLMERIMQRSKENALRLLNEDMVTIYSNYFSNAEIEEFIRFYQTPAGQKLLNQTPAMMKDVMDIMYNKYQKDFQNSLMKDVEEMTKELQNKVQERQG